MVRELNIELVGELPISNSLLRVLILETLATCYVDGTSEVGVHFVGEEQIQSLNSEHRGVDAATDVLSFPIDEMEILPEGVPRQLGDLFICVSHVAAQVERGETMYIGDTDLARAIRRCIVHGTLHLLGEDHELSQDDADRMFELEQRVLDACKDRT